MKLPLLSLFCGAGGLDCGFRQEGFRTVLAIDNYEAAIKSFNFNAKSKVAVRADLSEASADEIIAMIEERSPGLHPVGVLGGPPCQGFSYGNVYANPRDPRNRLPFKYAELLGALNKRYALHFFVFENVLGLTSSRHTERFKKIKRAFEDAGFGIAEEQLNAKSFGVPQSRPRLFLVGLNRELYPDKTFKFPSGDAPERTVRDAIDGLPAPALFAKGLNSRKFPHHPNHWTMVPKSPKFESAEFSAGRSFKRLVWSEPSPTVAYGNREIHIHPNGKRRLSVYEAMLLQGFPARYRLSGNLSEQITQVCNAVPPPVAGALARMLRGIVLDRLRAKPAKEATAIEEHAHE